MSRTETRSVAFAVLQAQVAATRHRARATRREAIFQIAASQTLRRAVRRIMGGSDADVRIVEYLLIRDAVCATCLARHVGLVGVEGARLVERFERTLILAHEIARCEACEAETTVYGIRGGRRFPFPLANGNGAVAKNGGPPPDAPPGR